MQIPHEMDAIGYSPQIKNKLELSLKILDKAFGKSKDFGVDNVVPLILILTNSLTAGLIYFACFP